MNIHVRSLEAQEIDSKTCGIFLTPLVLSRLPPDVGLSSSDFVLAFRRFSSRRGIPDELISDNAKTFKGAQPLLLQPYASNCPKWSYISPRSPWRGGILERLVRSVKNSLKQSDKPTQPELSTTRRGRVIKKPQKMDL